MVDTVMEMMIHQLEASVTKLVSVCSLQHNICVRISGRETPRQN